MRTRVALAATIVTVAAGVLVVPGAASAFNPGDCTPKCDLVVDSTADAPDAHIGDDACATAAGDCTLRAAVQEANAMRFANVLVPRGTYVLTRHGLDDDASHGDLDVHFIGRIIGAGQSRTVVDGDDADRVFDVHQDAEGSISHLQVEGGVATDGPGGGIRTDSYPYHLSYLYVTDNEAAAGDATGAGNGGGIAALVETDVQFTYLAYNQAVNGGGMWWHGIQGSFRNDAFVGNHASADGGGLYLTGYDNHFSNLTLSANTAGAHGGGVYLTPPPESAVSIGSSTIASNTAPSKMGGGIWVAGAVSPDTAFQGGSSLIVARNGGGDCAGPGSLSSGGGNIDGDGSCGFKAASDQAKVDPLLGPVAYNGGPTPTRALQEGSPAIDAVPCSAPAGTDQRGVSRPQGPACDIGAFEVGDCCPDYEAPYTPTVPPPPPPPREGDCGVLRFGTNGADELVGDGFQNEIYGRDGNDRIFGRYQADCLYGGRGDDYIRGGNGTDLLVGSFGNDNLGGGDHEDVVRGGRGNDRVIGGPDEDRLFGGRGADVIKGGDGYDTIDAGPGNDTIDTAGQGLDTVDCGPGDDHVSAKRHDRLTGCEHVHYVD